MVSLGFTWIHLSSLGFTWIHIDSLGFILGSLGFICIHLNSSHFTWIHLHSLEFARIHWDSLWIRLGARKREHHFHKGKGKGSREKREKGKPGDSLFDLDLTRQRHRAYARTTRNETISRLDSPPQPPIFCYELAPSCAHMGPY